ncbi:MAG: SirB2 family protein [Gammaproteobacteria bacterium]
MSLYETIKVIHITTAGLSFCGFLIRGVWMMQSSSSLQSKWVKIVPHVNDTILLATAIILVVLSLQYPISTAWVNAKIIALLVYILLGTIALKRGKTMSIRVTAWGLAMLVFIYVLAVASTKSPMIV